MIQLTFCYWCKNALYGAKTLILLTQTTHFDFDISRFCSLTIN
ncbi:hypothetical protein EcWSU1_04435 [Enterobacter ludwigii]|uniref:Uncharacterized protein n=1 Tax=Enterobacter ludwigii TaxID=299767 RepID=G8LLQ2_9ENTR|nr:hypothetical protein EcWSU1_04435 [Enterobacter ludwigii]